ncbi:MAG: response regulator transcription factor [Thermoleophilia bacterium]|nr:response regulator transcription factor [Thermoleophilia bacterium]
MIAHTSDRERLRVLIVDDHAVVRAGMRLLLADEKDLCIIGEAGDAEDALHLATTLKPDVIVLDLGLGMQSGLDVLGLLRAQAPEARIVILTMHDDRDYLRVALKSGASAYVLKQSADTDLLAAIRRAAEGDVFVDEHLVRHLVDDLVRREEGPAPTTGKTGEPQVEQLSERELQVAKLIALGHTNREVGRMLFLSVKTVETYRARVMAKLGFAGRAELVRHALREGWLEETPGR